MKNKFSRHEFLSLSASPPISRSKSTKISTIRKSLQSKDMVIYMKKLLISGFEPFGTEKRNPSWEAVKRLPDVIGNVQLTKLCLPVVFGEAARIITDAADKLAPDAVIAVGLAGGRDAVTPEFVGINLRHASIPDNAGELPLDEPIIKGGDAAYFSTLPVRKMIEAMTLERYAVKPSYTAGTYVCNEVLYSLLAHFHGSGVRAGFIHVPYDDEQGREGVPSLELGQIVGALECAIRAAEI